MFATKGGMANRFSEGEVRIVGRNGQGVIGMRLKDKDEVIGMSLVRAITRALDCHQASSVCSQNL